MWIHWNAAVSWTDGLRAGDRIIDSSAVPKLILRARLIKTQRSEIEIDDDFMGDDCGMARFWFLQAIWSLIFSSAWLRLTELDDALRVQLKKEFSSPFRECDLDRHFTIMHAIRTARLTVLGTFLLKTPSPLFLIRLFNGAENRFATYKLYKSQLIATK